MVATEHLRPPGLAPHEYERHRAAADDHPPHGEMRGEPDVRAAEIHSQRAECPCEQRQPHRQKPVVRAVMDVPGRSCRCCKTQYPTDDHSPLLCSHSIRKEHD